ncbi:glycosyltransferase family 4 protein [Pedobacter nutrimenti]|uniref:Mannosyltransferase n=1 Tax=Pedobacter nutrimenti TaxID=1241337 RepID=A0A318UN01_9SPHI|nr:glycosyltransferase family 1 protein [Pedobacter nutrimenti]PYF75455.1 mannosyltransferase [Pedobacter nutrimenti]
MRKLNVYFDNTIFVLQRIGGISIVFTRLIERLKKENDIELNLIINRTPTNNLTHKSTIEGVNKLMEIKIPKFLLPFMPLFKRLPDNTIYHSTYNRYSFQRNIIKIITIHDLGYELKIMRRGLKRMVHLFFKKIAIQNSNAIICVSENTKRDLERFYGKIIKDKVVKVIYNGISDDFIDNKETSLKFERKYVLYVGGRQQYKNFEKVVSAVAKIEDFDLIIAGGGKVSKTHLNLLNLHLPNRFSIKTNLEYKELSGLYSQAYCLVYPSSYEGFGLPLIEAMSCGCPVIACDNSCIREITGNAALLINSATVSNIKTAIMELKDDNLKDTLVKRGIIIARSFTWDKTAEETLKLYKELIYK